MTALIDLEVDDFARAARTLSGQVGDPLTTAFVHLIGRLQDCGAMAGSDPAGQDWATQYDTAALATLRASGDVLNGCYRLAAMFTQTARNYEAADAASSGHSIAVALPDPTPIGLAFEVPTAAGGSNGPPGHWGLIADLVGYVWPNGHQDRLRAAAAAWTASAGAIWDLSEYVAVAAVPAMADRIPEHADLTAVCDAMYLRMRRLAAEHRALAAACEALAGHIDQLHSEVEGELVSLVEWSAAIEGTGAVLSFFTFGLAEVPTQAIEAARVGAAAARVGQLIEKFIALARTVAQTVAGVLERVDVIAGELVGLRDMRLSAAVVNSVRDARTPALIAERFALVRLSGDAGEILLPGIRDPKVFDPQILRGMNAEEVRARIPSDWTRVSSSRGGGTVYRDPLNRGRQIRIMPGYPRGARPDPVSEGPYAVVSQLNRKSAKIPLAGNPVLP